MSVRMYDPLSKQEFLMCTREGRAVLRQHDGQYRNFFVPVYMHLTKEQYTRFRDYVTEATSINPQLLWNKCYCYPFLTFCDVMPRNQTTCSRMVIECIKFTYNIPSLPTHSSQYTPDMVYNFLAAYGRQNHGTIAM